MIIVTREFQPVGVADIPDPFESLTGYIDRLYTMFGGTRELLSTREYSICTYEAGHEYDGDDDDLEDRVTSLIPRMSQECDHE